jgi:hypothetical protein
MYSRPEAELTSNNPTPNPTTNRIFFTITTNAPRLPVRFPKAGMVTWNPTLSIGT